MSGSEGVPFACTTEDGSFAQTLVPRRVTQCALSRICGACGESLGRPIAFVGSESEAGRNAFHFPPLHPDCAEMLVAGPAAAQSGVLGQDEPVGRWVLLTTSGFEFVRPNREDSDRRVSFVPNSIMNERRFTAGEPPDHGERP
ncbi:MAG: hypothetical protein M3Z50_03325 [Actinomycetota bacterium]|nr:hypothetical protein [Actinomycetota bacterium]